MIYKKIPDELINKISNHQSFFILSHSEPDGDCICSSLAFSSFLRRLGKKTALFNPGPFERKDIVQYAPLFKNRIETADLIGADNPAVLIFDCSTLDRIGSLAQDIRSMPVYVIDHHTSGENFGTYSFIDSNSPSTTLIVQRIIEAFGEKPSPEEAELIMYGFCTDTGFFRHLDERSSEAFSLVSRLVSTGVSPKETYTKMNSGATLGGRKHLGMLLERCEDYAQGQVLLVWETQEETLAVGKKNRESDQLYQLLLGIEGVELVIALREESKKSCTGGLRSRKYFDAGELATKFGGGGHKRAAGFLFQGSLEEVKEAVLKEALPFFK